MNYDEKKQIENRILQEKKHLLKQAQELKKLIVEQQQNRNKEVTQRIQEERQRIVRAYMLQIQARKHLESRFENGKEKPMTDRQLINYKKEEAQIQKSYREELYKIDTDHCKKDVDKLIEAQKPDWQKKGYVSNDEKKQIEKSINNLRLKAGMEEKSFDYNSIQKETQKEQIKPKEQER